MEESYSCGVLYCMGPGMMIFILAFVAVILVAMWKVFTKAGQPGWGCLIPIYNMYLMIKIAGKPGWWLLLLFLPLVNFVINIIVLVEIAKRFGKGGGFAVGLILLPIVFFPILAFGSAQYAGGATTA